MSRFYTINDKKYPSVTTILSVIDKGEGLKKWLTSMKNWNEAQEALRASAERGSYVDDLIKKIINGETPECEKKYEKYLKAYRTWAKEWNFKGLTNDEVLFSDKYGFAGTLDIYGELENKKVIIDIKTGKSIYPEYGLQVSAYKQAKEEKGDLVEETWILLLKEDGEYEFKPINNFERNFKAFLAAKELYEWKHGSNNN